STGLSIRWLRVRVPSPSLRRKEPQVIDLWLLLCKHSVNPSVLRFVPTRRALSPFTGSALALATLSLFSPRSAARYDVSSAACSPPRDQTRCCSALRFHGKNWSTSSAASPPACAQAVRYAVSQTRGFNCHRHNV